MNNQAVLPPAELPELVVQFDQQIIAFFFWAFAILFTLFYLIYSILLSRQSQQLNKTVQTPAANTIFTISSVQIPIATGLFVFAIVGFGMSVL